LALATGDQHDAPAVLNRRRTRLVRAVSDGILWEGGMRSERCARMAGQCSSPAPGSSNWTLETVLMAA
jgi:hypothetical protein